ncbi:beta-lactamase-like protein [Elsinoe ampelina]|uniref:Beta-lactamase-like protein n=1 Tax=Elsinoe ampelina TaxID=302913 RepID=A0A6A6GIQ9_9PEZI|nr:beta-lactamase-like protein [Elsinoe ampelina]
MASRYMVPPQPPPDLKIPTSDATVEVSCIDSTTCLKLPMSPFLQPNIKGKEFLTGPAFSFLIRHSSGKQVLFDLGTRKDWQNLPPVIVDRITSGGWTVTVDKNISTILTEHSIPVSAGAIDAVIWSHHHWDHVGDMSTFPKSTSLVVGPGFQAEHLPGYPDRPDAPVMAEDFRGRTVVEIDPRTDGKGLKLGRFWAHDYFGDGSFYLLDTPGHSVGHICGLARTTGGGEASTFVFMGGDACHHGGEFRPSRYLPLPEGLEPSPVPTLRVCPGSLLTAFHRSGKATEPFYEVTPMFAHDVGECNWTIDGVEEFDAQGNVLVLIAHDDSVEGEVEMFPRAMNDWCEKGVKERVKWRFLRDFAGAVET